MSEFIHPLKCFEGPLSIANLLDQFCQSVVEAVRYEQQQTGIRIVFVACRDSRDQQSARSSNCARLERICVYFEVGVSAG